MSEQELLDKEGASEFYCKGFFGDYKKGFLCIRKVLDDHTAAILFRAPNCSFGVGFY